MLSSLQAFGFYVELFPPTVAHHSKASPSACHGLIGDFLYRYVYRKAAARRKRKRGSSVARLAPRPTFIRKDEGIVSFGCQAAIRQRDEPVLRCYR